MIRVAVKEIGKTIEFKEIKKGLESLQEIVEGYLEPVSCNLPNIEMLANEEGKLRSLQPNFKCGNNIIVGNVVFARVKNSNYESITDEDFELIKAFIDENKLN